MFNGIREFRVGRPQVYAGVMLLAFVGQCAWVASTRRMSPLELQYVESGLPARAGQEFRVTSPFTGWVAALPFRIARVIAGNNMSQAPFVPGPFLARVPFMIFGVWLGSALWWVARRLFDDAGGYVALALYCSSPAMVMVATNTGPEIILAWSIFGLIYTAIGVAHTLYAPPRKWLPRIGLLGLSIGFAAGTELWSFTVVLLAFGFMLYLAPGRRRAALMVILSASAVGVAVCALFIFLTRGWGLGVHSLFEPRLSSQLLQTLNFVFADGYFDLSWRLSFGAYVFVLAFIAALTTYGSWDRARYFGNSAPLISGFTVVLLFNLIPGLKLWDATLGLSFVFVFVGGISADLLETGFGRGVARILTAGVLIRAVLTLMGLSRWIHAAV